MSENETSGRKKLSVGALTVGQLRHIGGSPRSTAGLTNLPNHAGNDFGRAGTLGCQAACADFHTDYFQPVVSQAAAGGRLLVVHHHRYVQVGKSRAGLGAKISKVRHG